MSEINEEDFFRWKKDPVTKKLIDILQDRIMFHVENWANCAYLENNLSNAKAIGIVDANNFVINITYDDIKEDLQ